MTLPEEIIGGAVALLAAIHMAILMRLVKRLDVLQEELGQFRLAVALVSERVARLERRK